MSALTRRVAVGAPVVLVGSLLALLAASPRVGATTVYGCAKSGAAIRLESKKIKCKKGESKLAWGTIGPRGVTGATGPAGATGPTGATGPAGAPGKGGVTGATGPPGEGAAVGYSASKAGEVELGAETVAVEKELPPGNYLISAKVETRASAEEVGDLETRCELVAGAKKTLLDSGQWIGELVSLGGEYMGANTMPLASALTITTEPETVSVVCHLVTIMGLPETRDVVIDNAQLQAVQTGPIK